MSIGATGPCVLGSAASPHALVMNDIGFKHGRDERNEAANWAAINASPYLSATKKFCIVLGALYQRCVERGALAELQTLLSYARRARKSLWLAMTGLAVLHRA
jgi:hypothetical protein